MAEESLIELIADRISSISPYKAVLFGSHAYGKPDQDSDIDIIVVLNKTGFPASFEEKMENHRIVSKLLRDINEKTPLDVIVYTIDEWNAFIASGSYFSRVVLEKGRAIA